MSAPTQQEARAREIAQSCNIYSDYAEKVFAQALARERAEGAREEREAVEKLITIVRERHEDCEQAAHHRARPDRAYPCGECDALAELAALRARDATPLTVGQAATP